MSEGRGASAPLAPDPAVLPGERVAVVVAAVADVGAVAEAELERLMRGERNGGSHADAGILLVGEGVVLAVGGDGAAPPVIGIDRHPQARTEVVAQVRLEGTHRSLAVGYGPRVVGVIAGEEPASEIGVYDPVPDALRITDLRLEAPLVGAP